MTHPTLGSILREARQSRGWTLVEVGEKTGIDFSMLAKYERDEVGPPASRFARLCRAYGLSAAQVAQEVGWI